MNALKSIAKPVSWLSLLLIVIPPFLLWNATLGAEMMKHLMFAGTVIWFLTTPLWMKSE